MPVFAISQGRLQLLAIGPTSGDLLLQVGNLLPKLLVFGNQLFPGLILVAHAAPVLSYPHLAVQ